MSLDYEILEEYDARGDKYSNDKYMMEDKSLGSLITMCSNIEARLDLMDARLKHFETLMENMKNKLLNYLVEAGYNGQD